MNAARGGAASFAVVALALTIANACGSFGEGSGREQATDGGDRGDVNVASDGASDADPQRCPTDALACHFFEGALAEDPWVLGGRSTGAGLVQITQADGRSFLRVGAEAAPAVAPPYEERLVASWPPQAGVVVSFDVRIDAIDLAQLIELVTVAYVVSDTEYRFAHVILAGRQPRITEYAEPSKSSADIGTASSLSAGWHRLELAVDHVRATTSLRIDDALAISGRLRLTPAAPATECLIKVGCNHVKTWRGPISVDVDSVVVKPLP